MCIRDRIASLEGGVGAMLTSSGQAASLLSILNLCSAGDSFIAASTIYEMCIRDSPWRVWRRLPTCDRCEIGERQSGYRCVALSTFSQFTDLSLIHI